MMDILKQTHETLDTFVLPKRRLGTETISGPLRDPTTEYQTYRHGS